MKKFKWRLQRLLDIRIKQEEALRSELIAITESALGVRSQIITRKSSLNTMLTELGEMDPRQRVQKQVFVLHFAQVAEKLIDQLKEELNHLEEKRKQKTKEILNVRKYRKSLEKLRESAKEEYIHYQTKLEQDEMDDRTTTIYARKILQN